MHRLNRLALIIAFLPLMTGVVVSQELTCPGTPVPDQECAAWHYHVEVWLPDLNSFQRIYAFAPLATATECQTERDGAETRNRELISKLQAADPERSFQASRFGPCHCDRTSDRSNAFYLSDAQRRAQMRVAAETEATLQSMAVVPQELIATAEGAETASDVTSETVAPVAETKPSEGQITQEDLLAPPPSPVPENPPAAGATVELQVPPPQDAQVPASGAGFDGPAAPLPPADEPSAASPTAAAEPVQTVVDEMTVVVPAPPAPAPPPTEAASVPSPQPAATAPPVPATTTAPPATRPVVVPVPPTPAQAASGVPRTDKVVLREGSPDAPRIEIKWSKEREAKPPQPGAATPEPAPASGALPAAVSAIDMGENPFLAYEMSRVQEIIKASDAVTDDAAKAQIFEASMQRLQVLDNLSRLDARMTSLATAMRDARNEASRVQLVGRLFGDSVRRHWAPTDARGVILPVPPEIDADPSGALSQSATRDQQGLALYVVLARSSEMSPDQESGVASIIETRLGSP